MTKTIAIVTLCALALVSCKSTPADSLAFHELDRAWADIGPRYVQYTQSDPALGEALRAERVRTAEMFGRTLKEFSR